MIIGNFDISFNSLFKKLYKGDNDEKNIGTSDGSDGTITNTSSSSSSSSSSSLS